MRSDALRPLPSSFRLSELAAFARSAPADHFLPDSMSPCSVGGWVRGGARPLRLRIPRARTPLLVSSDLRHLLAWCDLVLVRRGERVVPLRGRPLQSRLALRIAAGECSAPRELVVPMRSASAEAVLADCVRDGVTVRGSRVLRFD